MASTGGGKIRSKRSKGSSKPYARRTSLLGRVSESVRDFITPSWLSNMWQGVPEEEEDDSPDGRQERTVPVSNAVTDPQQQQSYFGLPHSRPHREFSVPENTDNPDVVEVDLPTDVVMEDQPSTSAGQGTYKTPFNRYTKPLGASTPNDDIQIIAEKKPSDKEDTASDTSVSTSGCSSLLPHLDKADHREKLSKFNLDRLSDMGRHRTDSPRFGSDSPRLRSDSPRNTSLWSDTSMTGRGSTLSGPSRPQQSLQSSRKPTFNTSYFCTPRGNSSFGNTSTTDSPGRGTSFMSPFYPGKTTFGGSSSQRSAKRPRTSPYEVHLPIKKHVRIRPSSRNDVTSQTAKRILETLEKMSTPLSDAKKIPLSPTSSPFSFTPGRSSRLRQSGPPHAPGLHERGVRIPGPPTTGLRIPQVASIADNKHPPLPLPKRDLKREQKPETVSKPPLDTESRLPSSGSSMAGFSFKSAPSTSTTAPARTGEDRLPSVRETSKSSGKMRSSKRETHYTSPVKEEDEIMEVPDLPNVPLPLANGKTLPTFQFGSSNTQGPSDPLPWSAKPLVASTPFSTIPSGSENTFKFASPILKNPPESSPKTAPAPPVQALFKFSAPKQAGLQDASSTASFAAPTKVLFGASMTSPSSNPKPNPEREKKKEEEEETAGGGYMVAKELKKGSCLEVLGILSKSSKDATSDNANKPQAASSSTISTTKPLGLAEKFKPAPGTWSCPVCMEKNKPEADKCACCPAAKLGGAKPPPSIAPLGQNSIASKSLPGNLNCGFGAKLQPAPGTWKCDTCMIKNKPDSLKCVACMSSKPGAAPHPVNSLPTVAAASIGFDDKFKPAAGSWKCDTCMVPNKGTVSRCVACETPKPGSQQILNAPPASAYKFGNSSTSEGNTTGGFQFGLDTASQSSGKNATESTFGSNADSVTKGGFKFGVQSTTFSLTTSEAKQTNTTVLKPFNFGPSANDGAKSSPATSQGGFKMADPVPGGFKFGSAVANGSSTDDKSSAPPNADPFASGVFSAPNTTKLAVTKADSETNAAAGLSAATTKPTFNFGVPAGAKTDASTAVNFGTSNSTSSTEQKSMLNFGGPKTDTDANQTATSKPVHALGSADQKDSSLNPAFRFGAAETPAPAASESRSIFEGAVSKQPSQDTASSEQSSVAKSLFNFKSSASSTNIQFGTSGNAEQNKPAQVSNTTTFNFTGATDTSKSLYNFGAPAKTNENKDDAGSTNSMPKSNEFVFGVNAASQSKSSTTTSNTTPAANTPFKFGESAPQNTGGFTFNAAPASTTSQITASSGGFTFNAIAPATTQPAPPAFGAATTTTTTANSLFPAFGSNASSANPSPVFGNPAPTTTAMSAPNFGTAAATPFGSQSQQQGAVPPAFGAANSGTPFGSTPTSAFGAGATPTFGASNAAPAFGGNNATTHAFGNSNATQQNAAFQSNASTPTFQFSAAANQPSAQQNSSVFKFGGAQNNNAATQNSKTQNASQGFNFSTQPASFNFSGATQRATTTSAGASPFQFNASAVSATSNPFSATPTPGSSHSGRKIKRAVRRNTRK